MLTQAWPLWSLGSKGQAAQHPLFRNAAPSSNDQLPYSSGGFSGPLQPPQAPPPPTGTGRWIVDKISIILVIRIYVHMCILLTNIEGFRGVDGVDR